MDELKQLVFTDHNGAKVLQVSFNEFAYLLGSGTVTALPANSTISSQLRARLKKIVRPDTERKGAEERKARSRVQTPVEQVSVPVAPLTSDAQPDVEDVSTAAELNAQLDSQLVFGAIFILNTGEQLVEARIAVDNPGQNQIIFVDRKGFILGEFTRNEVANLLSQEKCEFVSCGGPDLFREVITELKSKQGLTEDS